jgi:hypothetical protein
MLSAEQRAFLVDGPKFSNSAGRDVRRLFGGAASVIVSWRRHRQELLDASPPGVRPWCYWRLERRLKCVPRCPTEQARIIRTLGIFRDERERRVVARLLELDRERRRTLRESMRAVA